MCSSSTGISGSSVVSRGEHRVRGDVTMPDGTPVPGVAISNGLDIVDTGPDGSFNIDRHGSFVTMSRPSGFRADRWWERATERPIRFVLEPEEQALPFTFAHLTDIHMTVDPSHPRRGEIAKGAFRLDRDGVFPREVQRFLEALPNAAPEVQRIVVTGDLVDNGHALEFEAFRDTMALSPVPIDVIPGNHDHMTGGHSTRISRHGYAINDGDPALYESYFGPRWFSFAVAGLHFVAVDWHTHELGIDHSDQNSWLACEISRLDEAQPWVLLCHDQPSATILDEAPRPPIATFSGHWHTSRVITVGPTLHVNSAPTFFAGLDYSPPSFRVVTWDGETLSIGTRAVPSFEPGSGVDIDMVTTDPDGSRRPSPESSTVWTAQLAGTGLRQSPVVRGDVIVAATFLDDVPRGFIESVDARSGDLLWRTPLRSAAKSTPAVAGENVVVAEVSGDVVAVRLDSGEEVWRTSSSDPLRRFSWAPPVVAGTRVVLGDQTDLRCLDASTGAVLWRRTDIGPHHNLVGHAAPLIVDDVVYIGLWPTPRHPIALSLQSGEHVWRFPDDPGSSQDLLRSPRLIGTAVHDAASDSIIFPAHGGTTAVDRTTASLRWSTPHGGGFSPATPVVTERGILVTIGVAGLRLLDRDDGEVVWDVPIHGSSSSPMSSYAKAPHTAFAPALPVPGDGGRSEFLLPGLDGAVRRVTDDGSIIGVEQFSAPFASAFVPLDDDVLAMDVSGALHRLRGSVAS